MTTLATVLILGAALLHASWNAILRGGSDRYWSIVVICATSVVVALPVVLTLPPPARACWAFLGISTVLQDISCLLLVRGYRDGDLAQVYPIARGSSPLIVTVGAHLCRRRTSLPGRMAWDRLDQRRDPAARAGEGASGHALRSSWP